MRAWGPQACYCGTHGATKRLGSQKAKNKRCHRTHRVSQADTAIKKEIRPPSLTTAAALIRNSDPNVHTPKNTRTTTSSKLPAQQKIGRRAPVAPARNRGDISGEGRAANRPQGSLRGFPGLRFIGASEANDRGRAGELS
ncbi:hypothetical protein Tc00.1047053507111.10 [Trypanosoma cruzi]|uniref:Uncharacterized protein n=1 Tax=Trypanosoma cruzi (strain CL Brener) TaxID=353153 RepID=Q4CLP4_TRYCC|nr:hypothetical protein Tc00.1047053507111.10 [Trypanosoma cruzi]EAN81196.1 hypothetical protein Tc00.1047053507111.10 [Trypanosoma cruzi]|eukprot:XP_802642.1 hypothetical protein [Trypanosoma cruzi strain CL Brener]